MRTGGRLSSLEMSRPGDPRASDWHSFVCGQIFNNVTSEALAFRAGEVNLDPQVQSPGPFTSIPGARLVTTPSCADAFLTMNTESPPWNDVHVRRAIAYALDRPDLIIANGGYAAPLYTFISPARSGRSGARSKSTASSSP